MRPRFLITMFFLIIAILVVVFWLRPKQSVTVSTPIQETFMPTNSPLANKKNTTPQNVSHAPSLANQNTIVTHKVETPEQARQEIESANVPVKFYGKLIDQDSNALVGVNIKIIVRHWIMADPISMLAGSRDISLEQKSEADGRFELTGATGDGFDITSVQKNGYELEPGQRSYGAIGGSYDSPVIFKMWSTNIHEQLITGNKSFGIVPDGRAYFIDLTTDTINESGKGDLKVWIQYTNQVVQGQLYDWSAGIEMINGSLCSSDSYAMYEAPTDGYVPSFQLSGQIKGGSRGDIGERRFYLKLKNGQEYGQMTIEMIAPFNNQTPGLIHVSYAINPSGSHILR